MAQFLNQPVGITQCPWCRASWGYLISQQRLVQHMVTDHPAQWEEYLARLDEVVWLDELFALQDKRL